MSLRFDQHEFGRRAECIVAGMREAGLDILLLVGVFPEKEGHVCYVTNYRGWRPQWPSGPGCSGVGFSFAICRENGDVELIAPALDKKTVAPTVSRIAESLDVYDEVTKSLRRHIPVPSSSLGVAGLDILPGKLLIEIQEQFPAIHIVDAEHILQRARLIKSTAEHDLLIEMGGVSDSAVSTAVDITRVGRTCAEIAGHCVRAALEAGAEHVLRCRLRSGPETGTVCWPYASTRPVEQGEIVQIDLVGIYGNYIFDVSRIWTVGPPSTAQTKLFETAAQMTQFLTQELRPGQVIGDIADKMVALFSDSIPSATPICEGHSCGMDVVEFPWIASGVSEIVENGMFLNVEPFLRSPGVYTVKIEDQFIVGNDANRVINRMPQIM
jgi:Xaa-Pro aminopeptidase